MSIGLRKKSLLVVEDNWPMQGLLQEMGTNAGFNVRLTGSRDEAFDAIRRQRFDGALVDLRLFESDSSNEDGLEVLDRLHRLGEGTVSALLTAYGTFPIAAKVTREYGAQILVKGTLAEFRPAVQSFLGDVVNARYPRKFGDVESAWSGGDDSVVWSTRAKTTLTPRGDYEATGSLLEELLLTCDPILERPHDKGLERLPDQPALSGLFWSRGVGEPVIVTVSRNDVETPVSKLLQWPATLEIHEELYRAKRKNLVGIISRCSGVEPEDFQLVRSYLE
jgi:CheY-like chemotaxis protein